MFRPVISVCGVTALSLALMAFARAEPIGFSQASITGQWVGDARLFDKIIRVQATPLATELRIDENLILSGNIGVAKIQNASPASVSAKQVVYRALLSGPVKDIAQLSKKTHLIVIITCHTGDLLDADFHLKSRFGFDPTMRVGHMDVVRAR